ncbi:MAG: DsbA family protein [Actinomycetota bacterium]|nr:DsbA family protein [Actinomycetota bacterium]
MSSGEITFTLWADIACPWTHAAVSRWRRERTRRGLEERVLLELRSFPLELFNRRPTPKRVLDAEIPVAGSLAPEAGWQSWQRQPYEYAVSTLLALEAVHAAKEQGLRASEELDFALRRGFFGASRNVSLHHEIVEVADECEGVDAEAIDAALRSGSARRSIFEDMEEAQNSNVKGSPHFFLGEENWHNPGVQMKWIGKSGEGFPVIEKDDPEVFAQMFDGI